MDIPIADWLVLNLCSELMAICLGEHALIRMQSIWLSAICVEYLGFSSEDYMMNFVKEYERSKNISR